MKVIRCDLPYADVIELHPLSDLHLGDVHCDYKAIMERIEYIKNTPNAYCILGDKNDVDMKYLKSLGAVEFVTPRQIFGY